MFDASKYLQALKAGKCSGLVINDVFYQLSDAPDFQQDDQHCSGTLAGEVRFQMMFHMELDGFSTELSFSACTDTPVRIGQITLFSWQETESTPHPDRSVFAFKDDLFDQFVCKASHHDGKHTTRPMCLIYDLTEKKSFFAGQLSFYKSLFQFDLEFDPGNSTLRQLFCRINDCGYCATTEVVTLDRLYFRTDKTDSAPYRQLCQWADLVKQIHHVRLPEKIVAGFITGLLVSPKAEISTSQIRRQLHSAAVAPLRKLGMEYLWISLDNLKDTLPGNWLEPNWKKFPDGLIEFLQEVRACNVQVGFWIGLFQMCESTCDFETIKPYLIYTQKNELSPRGEWGWENTLIDGHFPRQYSLDPAKQEALEYIGKVFSTYAKWGIRYHMVDFLETGQYQMEDKKSGFDREAFLKFMRQISSFCHPDTQLLAATGASLSLIGAVPSSRIGLDYGEGRPLETFYPSYPATYVINGSFGSMGSPNRNAVNNLAMWAFAHDRFFQCSCNMMTVDKPIPLNEAIISASLFGISPSPVFFGDDMDKMAPERRELLKKVLPRCPGMPEPTDLFRRNNGEEDFVRTFVLKVEKSWGCWYVCAIFNLNDSFRRLELRPEELAMPTGKRYRMYNFWQESYCGVLDDSGKFIEISGNSAAVYRFEECKSHPWILSTDFHVRQGDAELEIVQWDENSRTLSGVVKRTAGEQGNLLIIADDSFIPEHANYNLMVSKSAIDMSIIIKKSILLKEDRATWKIHFD